LKIISFYGILNSKDFLAVVKNELDSYLIKLGLAIRKIRLSKGMTQLDLSSDSGIPLSQIGAIENGKLNTTIKTLIKITSTLEVKLKDILEY
jgi:DNA-binding Xre family transcriptional regulator